MHEGLQTLAGLVSSGKDIPVPLRIAQLIRRLGWPARAVEFGFKGQRCVGVDVRTSERRRCWIRFDTFAHGVTLRFPNVVSCCFRASLLPVPRQPPRRVWVPLKVRVRRAIMTLALVPCRCPDGLARALHAQGARDLRATAPTRSGAVAA